MRWVALPILLAACRDPAPVPAGDAGPARVVPGSPVEPRSVEAKPEAGLVNPLCEGTSLSLFEASCEVSDAEWVATPAPEPKALVQEVAREQGGSRVDAVAVVFAVVNRSSTPVLVPLRWDDREPGKVFSAIAEMTDGQGIHALAPPRVALAPPDSGAHLHSTRMRLLPGGRATAHLSVAFESVERLDKRVDAGTRPDGGTRLEGPLVLHLGQLFSHVDTGDPATLPVTR